jgi:hypothetical protein
MTRRQEQQAIASAIAANIRQALKEAFPGARFRVSHLGYGSSFQQSSHVSVYWDHDGPAKDAVEAVCRPFETETSSMYYHQEPPLSPDLVEAKVEARRVSRMSYEQVDALFDETFAKMKAASGEEYNRLQGLVQVYNRRLSHLRRNEVMKRFFEAHGRKPTTNGELRAWHWETEKAEAQSE